MLRLFLFLFMAFIISCSKEKIEAKHHIKQWIAEEKYERALAEIEKESDKITKLNYLAVIYQKKGSFAKAEGYYKEMLKIEPNSVKALYNLGILKIKKKAFKEALELYQKLEKIAPENLDVKLKKAWSLYYLRLYSLAIDDLKIVVNTKRQALQLHQWKEISVLYQKMKRYKAAAEAYDYYISMAQLAKKPLDIKAAKRRLEYLRSARDQSL